MITLPSSGNIYEIYADFDSDMERDPQSFDIVTNVNVEALKTSIRNILLTRTGSRRMQPEFGAALEEKLFEPITAENAKNLGELIYEQIDRWDPDINVERVHMDVKPNQYMYVCTIYFSAKTASIGTSTMKFVLEQR